MLKNPQRQKSQQQQKPQQPFVPQHHNLLQYYKNKVEALCQQRLAWLSKFDQCKSKLQDKHQLKQKLLSVRNQQRQLTRALVHHDVALLDQRLNVLRMERENLVNDYRDAEEVVRISDLMEQYPREIQKMLPCYGVGNGGNQGQLIRNELNIHTSKQKKGPIASRSTKKSPPNSFNIKHSLSQKRTSMQSSHVNPHHRHSTSTGSLPVNKVTPEELLQRQIIELKQSHDTQLESMQQLKCKLEHLIKKTKEQEKVNLKKEREVVEQLNKEHKELEKRHKALAEEYFAGRRAQKQGQEDLNKEKEELQKKNELLEEKVQKELKMYEKENKAKQLLIIRKSEDFQQNYKAKMRAKQRNLQALKQNYEKMQNICIQKVTKLQNALGKARSKLSNAEQRRQFLVEQLRQQLHTLETRVQQQKYERQQRELKLKLKVQKQKQKYQDERQRREKELAKMQRDKQIEESYKRTVKVVAKPKPRKVSTEKPKKSLSRDKPKPEKRKDIYGKEGEESQDDDSLEMDDLENIRRQIGELQTKIAGDTK